MRVYAGVRGGTREQGGGALKNNKNQEDQEDQAWKLYHSTACLKARWRMINKKK